MAVGYLEVEPAVLGQIAGRLLESVAVAQEVAGNSGALRGSAQDAGHELVRSAAQRFLDRWGHGCECLVEDARMMADRLGRTSRLYVATETANAEAFSRAR